ncbi:MAG: hypothetical protein ACTHN5_02050 [Phycisphaerae bacterium]
MGMISGMGLGVERVVRCGEVRHQLTHRLMVFEVVRVEVENAKHKTQTTKRLGRAGAKEGVRQAERGEQVVLPGSVTAGGEGYVDFCWVGWPLEEGKVGGLALAKVVWKVAEAGEFGSGEF